MLSQIKTNKFDGESKEKNWTNVINEELDQIEKEKKTWDLTPRPVGKNGIGNQHQSIILYFSVTNAL